MKNAATQNPTHLTNPVQEQKPVSQVLTRRAGKAGRILVLFLLACLSVPPVFWSPPMVGMDPAWAQSLQLADLGHATFGRDFIFTYGPLGYLLTRSLVSKAGLILYDLFVAGSLVSLYRRLLGTPVRLEGAALALAVALLTRQSMWGFGPFQERGSVDIVFCLAGYWLWRMGSDAHYGTALAGSLVAATALFFGKVNFGLLMLGMIPFYGITISVVRRAWRPGALLIGGFGLAVVIGCFCWRVDLGGYLRSSIELASGYNNAMVLPAPLPRLDILLMSSMVAFTICVGAVALASWFTAPWRQWLLVGPFVLLAVWFFFESGMVRADRSHLIPFILCLPLLLAFWRVSVGESRAVSLLLALSVASCVWQLALRRYPLSFTPVELSGRGGKGSMAPGCGPNGSAVAF